MRQRENPRKTKLEASDPERHSFVVRLWEEPRDSEDLDSFWRGSVEHVASGEKRYMTKLSDMVEFVYKFIADRQFGRPTPQRGKGPGSRGSIPVNIKGIMRLWRSAG